CVRAAVSDSATAEPVSAIARADLTLDTPTPDAAEISPTRLWDAVCRAARHAVRVSGLAGQPGADIAAIGLSTFMPGLVLLGHDDQPLGPIWTHQDRRPRQAARRAVGARGPPH